MPRNDVPNWPGPAPLPPMTATCRYCIALASLSSLVWGRTPVLRPVLQNGPRRPEERALEDPRRPGGLPHKLCSIPNLGKTKWHHKSPLPSKVEADHFSQIRKTSLPSDNAIGAQTSCPARTCALAISLYAVVLASISRSLPLLPSSARNMLSASMKLPKPNEAFPSLVQTSLPSKSRQVNRPRFFLPTANRWPLCTIGVCTSEFHSLFFRSNRHSVLKAPPSRRTRIMMLPAS